ncbi:cell division protein FtsZ, partial [Candidatus Beckwithbacteria bacterium]|nr:cell division protein FtsZ [Candidatus Beckwithbacteria bacterium]
MALVKPDANTFARIKVVGIGGGGGNVINSMLVNQSVQGVDFIAINTDAQALLTNHSPIKLQIGEKLTKGLGSGSNPEVGKKAAEESHQQLEELLADSDMVFLACGMGGGTGTGATPVVADIARKTGALTVAVVTKPFLFEGTRRMVVADDGIEELRDRVDTLIVIPNQRLLETIDIGMRLEDAFKISDSVLGEGVQGISDLITTPGLINVDFADVRTIMTSSGTALMGIGSATGDDKAAKAAGSSAPAPTPTSL